ncbi:MAG: hypothetical protein WC867_02340 [Candidatus Pacearchaeota archaeon]|jgi:hypothetical protein
MVKRKSKKGAIELSVGTIVILVIAMTMLIMGLVLVRTIFKGATYNVEKMDEKVKDEIGKLFTENKRMVIYLPDNKADITQGDTWGVAFVVKNLIRGTSEEPRFTYKTSVAEIGTGCTKSIKEKDAINYIKLGRESNSKGEAIASGQTKGWIIRFELPENAPLCLIRYNIEVRENGEVYASEDFDVNIVSKD